MRLVAGPDAVLGAPWKLDAATVQAETGYTAYSISATQQVSVTVPTGTTRATAATAGLRIFVPLRDVEGTLMVGTDYPAGKLVVGLVSGIADAGNTGIRVWVGIVDGTALASATGVGVTLREDGVGAGSLAAAAWRIAGGVETEQAMVVGDFSLGSLVAQWTWTATDRRALSGGQALSTAGAQVLGLGVSASGSVGTGQLYAMLCVGLVDTADAGGAIVLAPTWSIV